MKNVLKLGQRFNTDDGREWRIIERYPGGRELIGNIVETASGSIISTKTGFMQTDYIKKLLEKRR